jgi:hypothetical protein
VLGLAETELFLDDMTLLLGLEELSVFVLRSGRGFRGGGDIGPRVDERAEGDFGPRVDDRFIGGGDLRLGKLEGFEATRPEVLARDFELEMFELLDWGRLSPDVEVDIAVEERR